MRFLKTYIIVLLGTALCVCGSVRRGYLAVSGPEPLRFSVPDAISKRTLDLPSLAPEVPPDTSASGQGAGAAVSAAGGTSTAAGARNGNANSNQTAGNTNTSATNQTPPSAGDQQTSPSAQAYTQNSNVRMVTPDMFIPFFTGNRQASNSAPAAVVGPLQFSPPVSGGAPSSSATYSAPRVNN